MFPCAGSTRRLSAGIDALEQDGKICLSFIIKRHVRTLLYIFCCEFAALWTSCFDGQAAWRRQSEAACRSNYRAATLAGQHSSPRSQTAAQLAKVEFHLKKQPASVLSPGCHTRTCGRLISPVTLVTSDPAPPVETGERFLLWSHPCHRFPFLMAGAEVSSVKGKSTSPWIKGPTDVPIIHQLTATDGRPPSDIVSTFNLSDSE